LKNSSIGALNPKKNLAFSQVKLEKRLLAYGFKKKFLVVVKNFFHRSPPSPFGLLWQRL
jgi:hypothetical protein